MKKQKSLGVDVQVKDGLRDTISEAGGWFPVDIIDIIGSYAGAPRLIRTFGGTGSNDGQFVSPRFLEIVAGKWLFVSDDTRVQQFSLKGKFIRSFALPGWQPRGLAVNEYGLNIADRASGQIYRVTVFRKEEKNVPIQLPSDSMYRPGLQRKWKELNGIEARSYQFVCSADFAGQGGTETSVSSPWRAVRHEDNTVPWSCVRLANIEGRGDYDTYLACSFPDEDVVKCISYQSKFMCNGYFHRVGPFASTTFKQPRGLTVDSQKRVFVCDSGNRRVVVLGRDRDINRSQPSDFVLNELSVTTTRVDELQFEPTGVAIWGSQVFVSCVQTNRLYVFEMP